MISVSIHEMVELVLQENRAVNSDIYNINGKDEYWCEKIRSGLMSVGSFNLSNM